MARSTLRKNFFCWWDENRWTLLALLSALLVVATLAVLTFSHERELPLALMNSFLFVFVCINISIKLFLNFFNRFFVAVFSRFHCPCLGLLFLLSSSSSSLCQPLSNFIFLIVLLLPQPQLGNGASFFLPFTFYLCIFLWAPVIARYRGIGCCGCDCSATLVQLGQ